jgi:hypothetical protein
MRDRLIVATKKGSLRVYDYGKLNIPKLVSMSRRSQGPIISMANVPHLGIVVAVLSSGAFQVIILESSC